MIRIGLFVSVAMAIATLAIHAAGELALAFVRLVF